MVSLIVPSLEGDISDLRKSIEIQSFSDYELIVVKGVSPNGRARNVGVSRSKGDIFVFIDDDATLGHKDVIKQLLDILENSDSIGVVGSSRIIPEDSTWLQRRIAKEIPRIEHAVVDKAVESNPSVNSRSFSEITTTCCAIRKGVFLEAGGFSEKLVRGVDTEFFFRVRKLGYRFILAPNCWVYHPPPEDIASLLRKYYLYGTGHAQEALKNPERNIGIKINSLLKGIVYLLFRTAILIPNIFIPYSFAYRKIEISIKPIKAIVSYINSWGYTLEYLKRKNQNENCN